MKRLTTILLMISLLASCSKKSEIKGYWVELNKFNSPEILKFDDDFLYTYKIGFQNFNKTLYKVKSDTLYSQYYYWEGVRLRFNDKYLSMYDLESDTIIKKYEKLQNSNFIQYFNEKKNANIELASVDSSINESYSCHDLNTIYLFKNPDYVLYLNGEKLEIDSLLYVKLWTKEPYVFYYSKTNLFIDKGVEVNVLNKVKDELSKSFRYNVSYFVTNQKGEFCNINGYLPPIDFTYPDSIKNIPPQTPPLPEYPRNNGICKEILLVELEKSVVRINDSICDFKSIIEKTEFELKNNRKPIIFLYFNEQLTFENYIKAIAEIKMLYYKYRNQLSQDKYQSDYLNLNEEKQEEIRKIYPLRIKEIRINELNEIKKYAL